MLSICLQINLIGVRGVILVGKWKKAGIVKLSRSRKVILIAIAYLESHKWLVVDVEKLLDVIAGHRFEAEVLESG